MIPAEVFGTQPAALWDHRGQSGLEAADLPVLVPPPMAGSARRIAVRAMRRPGPVLRCLAEGMSGREIASGLLLRDTARALGIHTVQRRDGTTHPLTRLLGGIHPFPVAAPPPRVNGLMIAQDEGPVIDAALSSMRALVEDLLVVDGGSADDTVMRASSHGARVIHRTFDNHFARQRNHGLDALEPSDWILTLDADEQVTPALATVLRHLMSLHLPVDAVWIPRWNLVGDDPVPLLWPDLQPRLFRSHLRYSGEVHETVPARRVLVLPANGPYIHHWKPALRQHQNSLRYNAIDPSRYTPEQLRWIRAEAQRLAAQDDPTDSGS